LEKKSKGNVYSYFLEYLSWINIELTMMWQGHGKKNVFLIY